MILEKKELYFRDFDTQSFVKVNKLLDLEIKEGYKEELKNLYSLEENREQILKIGNAKNVVNALLELDSSCEKLDIESKIRNVQLKKLFEKEVAVFEILEIADENLMNRIGGDILDVETAYSAKHDILDYYSLSKFANYCRDLDYEDLVEVIKNYLKVKNEFNEDECSLRLLYHNEQDKYYLRAVTSKDGYRDYGINFSVLVALIALNKYVEDNNEEIFINTCVVDDSTVYISFQLTNSIALNENLSLRFSLILENDEIKRNAVSFNGMFTLTFRDNNRESEIFLKPKGMKSDENSFVSDLLTYKHSGGIENVKEKIEKLPELIKEYIEQVGNDAKKIVDIENPNDVKTLIANKVKYSKKPEFKIYKEKVFNKLMSINVDNVFALFELLRNVEDLFEHTDVISKDFWRTKLYESLTEKK
ncbi:hypothetical protein C1637_09500 [Chryseobacterium lactis]|uniref:Uncharacterized protein n=1 Tax=Chryseobacterium lactis TaxID=1241981 RepID=A0A3G6RCZ3_CHRLC|nr:hypothetical protein [Chryseobacterium lactis]AZA82253.1 hypothetical protein EG342_10205 [Chryseobacterium lactis]AZB02635.1 hypothetical protein EG341_01065 [Chryseobacterium lactis]PNW14072.1 hypothetical protein C1637_09500 [Chryseobacterium lactis]